MAHTHVPYLPAFGRDHLLPLYDPLVRWLGVDRSRDALIEQAALRPGQRVLDIGCGTGTLAIQIKRQQPRVNVVGLDPDPRALARSRRKADRAGVSVTFDEGFGDALPYDDASFDRLFSSYMLHHIPVDTRVRVFHEARRVLKPGGSLHVLDFDGPGAQAQSWLGRRIHGNSQLRDNDSQRMLGLMRDAGFADVRRSGNARLRFVHVVYYVATRDG